jgi:hypothetical protein
VPASGADINPTHFAVNGHQLHSVSETTITPAVVGLGPLEVREDFQRANKQSGINRVIDRQILANTSHLVSARLNLHRVIQIGNRVDFAIYGHVKQTGLKVTKQAIDNRVIKNMVTHREEKRRTDMTCCCKQRDAVLFFPIAVHDEGRSDVARN